MTARAIVILALAASVASSTGARAQTPARDAGAAVAVGTGAIFGRVTTTEGSNRPIRRASVQVSGGSLRTGRQTMTDDDGSYLVDGLPDGHYTVAATKPAYVRTFAGGKPGDIVPPGPIDVANGQRVQADILMARGAVLSGLVMDPNGRPRPGLQVTALTVRSLNGKRSAVRGVGGGGAQTDDRGTFRIYGVAPGDYVLSTGQSFGGVGAIVTDDELRWARQQMSTAPGAAPPATPPPAARPMGYSPVYFPGTADLSAATIVTVGAGEERDNLDVTLVAVPLAKIEGTVTGSTTMLQLLLTSRRTDVVGGSGSFATTMRPNGDGAFVFNNVAPGSYTVQVRTPGANGPIAIDSARSGTAPRQPSATLWASADVDVDGQDITGLALTLQPAMTISGRVAVDSAAARLDLTRVRLQLSPDQPGGMFPMMTAAVAPDGAFTIPDVTPGRFRLLANLPADWLLKAAIVGGTDIADTVLDISAGQNVSGVAVTVSNRPASLSGSLTDGAGKGVPYWLVVFSTDRAQWSQRARRTRQARASATGAYAINGLPPGEYYMVAVPDLQQIDLTDPDTFDALATAGFKITIGEGEKKVQDLRLKTPAFETIDR